MPFLGRPASFSKERADSAAQKRKVFSLALPKNQNTPSRSFEFAPYGGIPRDVASELLRPKLYACLRVRGLSASGVPMPKTSVHEDNGPEPRKDEIRLPRQAFAVQPESETERVGDLAHHDLR